MILSKLSEKKTSRRKGGGSAILPLSRRAVRAARRCVDPARITFCALNEIISLAALMRLRAGDVALNDVDQSIEPRICLFAVFD